MWITQAKGALNDMNVVLQRAIFLFKERRGVFVSCGTMDAPL